MFLSCQSIESCQLRRLESKLEISVRNFQPLWMAVQICHRVGHAWLSSACGALCCAHQFVWWRAENPPTSEISKY